MSCLFNSLSYFINIKNNLEAADSRSTAEQRATKWSTAKPRADSRTTRRAAGALLAWDYNLDSYRKN